ncbi:MAG: HAMP domain-containing sensor histidine kinase [Clostridium sp.]
MIFLIGLLIAIIAFLLAYIYYMKKEMINISTQLNEYNDFKTEKKIDINLINKEVELLAESINRHIKIANELKLNERKSKDDLKEMVANISHDLRTPLTSIIGYIQMLKIKCNNDIKNMEYLDRVESKAKDLEGMLEDFFTLSVVDNSDYNLNLEYIDLKEILCDTLIGFYNELEKRGISPEINIEQVDKIIGERKSIIRIVENLMSNVLKYSSKKLSIKLMQKENEVSLIVMNSIENHKIVDVDKIFDKFYKSNDKSRTAKSVGLGLSIVKTLMEKMGGNISAKQIDNKLYITCKWVI